MNTLSNEIGGDKKQMKIIFILTIIGFSIYGCGKNPLFTTLKNAKEWIKEDGIRISEGSVPYVIKTEDGKYRVYYSSAGGISSAISEDGINFTKESGIRISQTGGQELIVADATVIKLDDGRYRMYYKGADGWGGPQQANHRIFSAISSDGLNFTKEGLRYENMNAPDYGWTSVPDAIKLSDGRVRIYYTGGGGINSIISSDGLNFTREEGTRLANGVDPNVIIMADGTFFMFYAVSPVPPQSIALAKSSDGLNWTELYVITKSGGTYDLMGTMDPSAIILPDGKIRVYYGGAITNNNIVTLSLISPEPFK